MNKYDKYEELTKQLLQIGYEVGPYKEINYGIQFDVKNLRGTSKVRVYESKKKGITVDLSQAKDPLLKQDLEGKMRQQTSVQGSSTQTTDTPSGESVAKETYTASQGWNAKQAYTASQGAVAKQAYTASQDGVAKQAYTASQGGVAKQAYTASQGGVANQGYISTPGGVANQGYTSNQGGVGNQAYTPSQGWDSNQAYAPSSRGSLQSQVANQQYKSDEWERPLIGVDESGKGDYFGPLIIAGVYADASAKEQLKQLGVMDSKKITDTKILKLAKEIKAICEYEVICLNNKTYNRLYGQIQNLNHLLAWGHGEVIYKLWEKTGAPQALSDQFEKGRLIQNQLDKKQVTLDFEQRPRAEENVVVAAASILARAQFVEHMQAMEEHWQQPFPKGAGPATVKAAKTFVSKQGKEALVQVAKWHFKTTEIL